MSSSKPLKFPWKANKETIITEYNSANAKCRKHREKAPHQSMVFTKTTATDWKTFTAIVDAPHDDNVTPDDAQILHLRMVVTSTELRKSRNAYDAMAAMKISRVPHGKPPVAYAHGVLWLYMIGSYVLLGDGISKHVPWMLGDNRASDYKVIKIGHVTVPAGLKRSDFDIVEDVTRHDGKTADKSAISGHKHGASPAKATPSVPKGQKSTKDTIAVPGSSKAQKAGKSSSRDSSRERKKPKILTDDEMLDLLRKVALEGIKCKMNPLFNLDQAMVNEYHARTATKEDQPMVRALYKASAVQAIIMEKVNDSPARGRKLIAELESGSLAKEFTLFVGHSRNLWSEIRNRAFENLRAAVIAHHLLVSLQIPSLPAMEVLKQTCIPDITLFVCIPRHTPWIDYGVSTEMKGFDSTDPET
ncbi:hypothetical protein N7520_000080 [Penicillium odoratum]|uniref:uncharacterized protein n=1 Tax=Penicillium odoratum TaxID=1167516 RepID=UPI002546B4F0|nr:uncharacterized protein N7520_000080 [Penicillium odoratum]KAJ5776834.1 hypothetical protein N7520_000080 [Penicillium odoratum]